jgi:hypothetical protein
VANVYSTRFGAAASVSGGPTTLYTVPAGLLAVVKDTSIVWGDIVASGLDAWFQDDAGAKRHRYSWAFTLMTPTNFGGVSQLWGMWVLVEGESIVIQTAAGTADFMANGYLLTLP